MKWRKQDWFWVTGILVIFNMLVMGLRLSDNQTFMNIFSFMVNGISIALAFVAMYTSFKQNSDNQTLTNQMSETLARMDEKINSMGQKVSEFGSIEELKKMFETRLNIAAESIEDLSEGEGTTISKDEVVEILNSELSKSLDQIVNTRGSKPSYDDLDIRAANRIVRSTIDKDLNSKEFTLKELQYTIQKNTMQKIPLYIIRLLLVDLMDGKYLIRIEPERNNDGEVIGVTKYKLNNSIN